MTREYFIPEPSARNLQMLKMRSVDHKTYSYIGKYFGVTKQRVHELVTRLRDRGLDKHLTL